MRHLLAFVFGMLLVCSLTGIADAGGNGVSTAKASDLVRRLGSSNFLIRVNAEQELLRRGAAAVPDVQRGAEDADPEVRSRSQALLRILQRSSVDQMLESFLAGKDDTKLTLPGWTALQALTGTDRVSRATYVLLYKGDRALLQTLERDPKALAEQYDSRFQKLTEKLNLARLIKEPTPATVEEVAGVMLIALAGKPGLSSSASAKLINLLYQPRMKAGIGSNDATLRLTEKWLEQKCADPALGQQAMTLALAYGSTEFINARLRPGVIKLVDDAAANPVDFNQLFRAVSQARQFNMPELVNQKLKPAIQKGIEAASKAPIDFNRLNQLANAAQYVGGMEADLRVVLRPTLTELVKKQAQQMTDMSRFYAIINLARISGSQDLIDDHLRPVYRTSLVKVAAEAKQSGPLLQAFYQAQQLGMHQEIDSILKPAVDTVIKSLVAQKQDTNSLQQAHSLATTFQMKEALRPTAIQLVADIAEGTPDIQRINLILNIARFADIPNLDDAIEKQIKPAARKSLLVRNDAAINPATVQQAITLAEQLQLKEGVDLALKAALTKSVSQYARGQAILYIAKNGTRDTIPQIEPLLADSTEVGTGNANGMMIKAQLGDVALAALIFLDGQKIDDYGYPWPGIANLGMLNAPGIYGFESDASRQAARKKWHESRPASKK